MAHGILQTVQNRLKIQKISNRDREEQKKLWHDGYATWTNEEFKDSLRMDRETFNFILCRIEQGIIKDPTVMVPNPIEPHRQLALTPGSTHDARLLRHCSLFRTICNGGGIPNKSVTLGMEI